MTVVGGSRALLDKALKSKSTTLLLLSNDLGEVAEKVHASAESILKPGQKVFLLTDLQVLTAQERKAWFKEGGFYAVVGGSDRVVAIRGTLDELMLSDGNPSKIEIRFVLARGDLLP
jgi:hypothetical protein